MPDKQIHIITNSNHKLAQYRALKQVSKVGHNIKPNIIKRCFQRGLDNLKDYLKIVDAAII